MAFKDIDDLRISKRDVEKLSSKIMSAGAGKPFKLTIQELQLLRNVFRFVTWDVPQLENDLRKAADLLKTRSRA